MGKLDFDLVKEHALVDACGVCSRWAPNGKKQGHEWVALNPTRSDSTAHSFSINLNSGLWADFATGDKGGDLISLVAYIEKCEQGEACKRLASYLGIAAGKNSRGKPLPPPANNIVKKPSFQPVYPPPLSEASGCPIKHFQLGDASQYWDYLSETGALLMRVCRFDRTKANGERVKEYRPCTYGIKNNHTKWHWVQLPKNRPMYGLEKLATFDASKPVIISEGEKACDATRLLFPENPCTTWSGGSKAISKTDFTPLAGRSIWFWPDNDEAGCESVIKLSEFLNAAGVFDFNVVNIELFNGLLPNKDGTTKTDDKFQWPQKADAADAVELGWKSKHFISLANTSTFIKANIPSTSEDQKGKVIEPIFGYKVTSDGVYRYDAKAEKHRRICARLDVLARSRDCNGTGRGWGMLIHFKDHDGLEKQWNIPMRLFAAEAGNEVIRGLFDRGLDIESHKDAKRSILDYLQGFETSKRVGLAYKMGWHSGAFVLPDRTIGEGKESIIFYSENDLLCKLKEGGTLDGWKENISKYCVGNPLAVFAVSSAFSAPLIELLGFETTGFHFFGDSSWGKSTLLNLACSVYGKPDDYKCTWRSTDNALESLASAHSDLLFALDEINQVDSRIIGDVVYMLGNGQGKHRANERGNAGSNQHRWKLTFLSNGEKTLEQYLADAGKSMTGGMEMRFLGLRATFQESEADRKKFGIFNNMHDFGGGAELSDHLRDALSKNHGTAFPVFMEELLGAIKGDRRAGFCEKLLKRVEQFKRVNLSADAGGQVIRAADKFALMGLAGELATQCGITSWPKGEATRAADECFKLWLDIRGGEGNLEDKQMLEHIRLQLTKYRESRFKRWDDPGNKGNTHIDSHVPVTSEMWGYRKELVEKDALDGNSTDALLYIYPQMFKREVCKGWDADRIARLLRDIGALELTEGDLNSKRLTTQVRLPGGGRRQVRVYRVRASMLQGIEPAC